MDDVDVTVIGAGPAGCLAAVRVARAGYSCRILERSRFPRFTIGESLLPRCLDLLEEADLLAPLAARGYAEKYGAWFLRGDERGGFDFADQFGDGRPLAWQVPRDDFDHTLAGAAADRGVDIAWEHTVTAIRPGPAPELDVADANGPAATLRTRFVIDASGPGRVVARHLGLAGNPRLQARGAWFTHVDGDVHEPGRNAGRIWICVHPDDAWLWIIPFADGRTSVGVVAPPDQLDTWLTAHEGNRDAAFKAVVASEPNAGRRLAAARHRFPVVEQRGYSATVSRLHGPGWCVAGNAGEFLDPVFSSGVTLAMEGASRASDLVLASLAGTAVDWDADYQAPMNHAVAVFRTYVEAWYDGDFPTIVFQKRPDPQIRARICGVLAGYTHDLRNPFVREHRRKVRQLARVLRARVA